MIGKAAAYFLRAGEVLGAYVKTAEARTTAKVDRTARVLSDGRVINISGVWENIKIGANARVRGELLVFRHAGRIEVGEWFYMGPGSTIWSSDPVGIKIGNRVLISMGVHIHDTNSHPLDPKMRFSQTREIVLNGHPVGDPGIRTSPIIIGDDVWVGFGATIFKGVRIGNRAIIGARAIVSGDVPDDGLVTALASTCDDQV